MNIKQKKIAIISDAIYPYNKGGKEKRIYEITTRLAAEGHDVTIYSMQWWKGKKTIVENGVTLHGISPHYPLYAGNRRSIKQAVMFALHCLKLINKDFDVIEVDHMPHLVLFPLKAICLLRRKTMIVTWHEVWGKAYWNEYLGGGTKAWVGYVVEATSVRLADMIISVSAHTTKNLRQVLHVKAPIVTVNNGLDVVNILGSEAKAHGADIVFAGRLLSHKNVDVLLRSVSLISKERPSISAWIIGEGPERASLEELAQKLHIEKNVSFLGFLKNQNDLYGIMKASKMFVLPSTREGFGIAAIEANACGIPVITVNHKNNATKELIIQGENGILVDLNEKKLARAIEQLLIGKRRPAIYRSYARQYQWDRAVSQIKTIYAI